MLLPVMKEEQAEPKSPWPASAWIFNFLAEILPVLSKPTLHTAHGNTEDVAGPDLREGREHRHLAVVDDHEQATWSREVRGHPHQD